MDWIDRGFVHVVAVEEQAAALARSRQFIVEPIDGAQQRALARARGADERGDRTGTHGEVDVVQRWGCAEPRGEPFENDGTWQGVKVGVHPNRPVM